MFGPDGQVHEVQQGDMQAAMQSGGELAHQLQGPDGQIHYVRHSQLGDALKSGGIPAAAIGQIPTTNVQPESAADFVNRITGHEGYKATPISPVDAIKGAANDAWTLTRSGYQAMTHGLTGGKSYPLGKPAPNDAIYHAAENMAQGFALGGAEGDVVPSARPQPAPEPITATGKAAPSLPGIIARHVPVVGRVLRMGDTLKEVQAYIESKTPQPPAPTPPAEPNYVYPGASLPATPTPEMLQARALASGAKPAPPNQGAALGTIPVRDTPPPTTADTGDSVPIGKLPIAKGNPYAGPRTPSSMEIAQSTNVGLHGYDPNSQTMLMQFKNGRVYEYRGLPQEVYDQYRTAESQGSFFANNIKGRYVTNFRGTVKPTAGAQIRQVLSGKASQ